ncbi:S26 family signal peptidase [Salinirubrum litoreum]|uniref:S26 family signal peptidase n=1 Tax=Salinirubrum litoreum TaxID=1126234 RepID=A0ABD5RDU0_9EURY|nr:S26 family signal peptidase [Salinirubrum litoreum]
MSAGDGPPSGDDGTGSSAGSDAGRNESDRPAESKTDARNESDRPAESKTDARSESDRPADADPTGRETPPPRRASEPSDSSDENLLRRFWYAEDGPLMFVREVLTSVLAVVAVGLLLFAISGVWPPMVAVESGSMEPHMSRGDLVFITEPGRYAPDAAVGDTGVVTHETGVQTGYRTFGDHGSVIIYDRPDRFGPPVIHRARLHVEDGENWYDRANPEYMDASNCQQLQYCPAPYAGFITKGDANPQYDQVSGIAAPVQERDIAGVARVRVPYLGYVRLGFATATQAEVGDEPKHARRLQFSTIVSSRNGGVHHPAESSAVRVSGAHTSVSTGTPAVA